MVFFILGLHLYSKGLSFRLLRRGHRVKMSKNVSPGEVSLRRRCSESFDRPDLRQLVLRFLQRRRRRLGVVQGRHHLQQRRHHRRLRLRRRQRHHG